MNVSKKTEAIDRMKALDLFAPCIKAFEKRDQDYEISRLKKVM